MKTEVFRRLSESTDLPVMWQEEDVALALNEGYMEISDATEWYETFQVIDLLDNQPYYDLRTVLRKGLLRIGAAFNVTTSRWLVPAYAVDLDRGDRRWFQRHEEPDHVIMRGLWWLCYWPIKEGASGQIKQYYRALPSPLSESTDEPGFHNQFHEALISYAIADLFAQDGETDLAWQNWKEYEEYEAKLRAFTTSRNRIPMNHGWRDEV